MYRRRRSTFAIIVVLTILLSAPAQAVNFVCAKDLNGDGNVDAAGESASCVTPTTGQLCPLDAVACVTKQVCPLDANAACVNGSCTAPQACSSYSVNTVCGQDSYNEVRVYHPNGETAAVGIVQCAAGIRYMRVVTTDSGYWGTPGPGCENSDSGLVDTTSWTAGMSVSSGNNGEAEATFTLVGSTTFRLDRNGVISGQGINICGELGSDSGSPLYTASLTVPLSPQTHWICPGTSIDTTDQTLCNSQCSQTASCTTTPPSCPLGNYACVDNAGTYQCSPTACVDLDAQPPTTSSIDSGVYANDGTRAPDGSCLGTLMIFSGRNMECLLSGVSTAYKNCCRDQGKVVQDSTGSAKEAVLTNTAISGTYQVASSAYTAYSTIISSGGSQAIAADAAATSAQGTAMVAFDPTSLAISLAIVVVVDYLSQGCSQQDMETGLLNGSGYCYQTGEYCKTSWPFFGCVQRARTYCCFNSKLARIIHQQGRPQLRSMPPLGSNICRGFTPEEFQYLDFSKIDLSEYYGDLKTQSMSVIQGTIGDRIQKFNSQLQ